MTVEYSKFQFFAQILLSHQAEKKHNNLKKKVYATMVGTFCATCAATGYPCNFVAYNDDRNRNML